jgi:hypothetical protein
MIQSIAGQQATGTYTPPAGGVVLMVCCDKRYETIEASVAEHPIDSLGGQRCLPTEAYALTVDVACDLTLAEIERGQDDHALAIVHAVRKLRAIEAPAAFGAGFVGAVNARLMARIGAR